MHDQAATAIEKDGFALIPNLFDGREVDALRQVFVGRTDRTLGDLLASGRRLEVGSEHGFREVMLRAEGRYDVPVPLDSPGFAGVQEKLRPVVNATLGRDAVCAFAGVVTSAPGAPDQYWHADGFHVGAGHGPANLLNVLIALHDIPLNMGPTEVLPGSHRLTNHHARPKIQESIVYQNPNNGPGLVGSSEQPVAEAMLAGSALVFDDRVLHRGRANRSGSLRYVGYLSFRRAGFEVGQYFEATRSLYPDVSSIAD